MNLEIHHGSNSTNDFANLHIQMAIPNTRFMEILLPKEAWWHAVIEDIDIDAEGFAHAPTKPGLGCEINLDLVESQKIAVLS